MTTTAAPAGAIRARETAAPSRSGVIDVRLRDLSQLFNLMDPSPFHERALDPDAEEFIVSSAKELPSEVVPSLVVFVDQLDRSPEDVAIVARAIRAHFARRAEMKRRELRQLLRLGRISLAIGLAFLAVSLVGGELVTQWMDARSFAFVLRESLVIGGWVAMWRPMEILLYDWWPVRGDQRLFDRLSRMEVRIVGADDPGDPRKAEALRSVDHAAADVAME